VSFTSAIKNPGPGAYNVEATLNGKGRYTLSKFSNSGANIISPPTSKRFGPHPYGTLSVIKSFTFIQKRMLLDLD